MTVLTVISCLWTSRAHLLLQTLSLYVLNQFTLSHATSVVCFLFLSLGGLYHFFCFSPLHSPLPISRWMKKNFFTGYKVKVDNIKTIVQNVPFWLSVDLTFTWFFVSYLMQYHSTTLYISRCPELRRTDHQQKAVLASTLCKVICLLSWVSFWLSHRLARGLGFVNIPKDPC